MENEKNIHNSEENNTSRRKFLKTGAVIGAGTLLAGGIVSSFNALAEGGDSINVLLPTGKEHQTDELNKVKRVSTDHLMEIGARNEAQMQKDAREGIAGKKWVMVIDLAKCQDARLCMSSCQNNHHLEEHQHHINVLTMDHGDGSAPYYMPKPCQHCDNPPCTKVCPVDATFKRQDGIVMIDNDRCIGCRFCIAACPYSARIFQWDEPFKSKEMENVEYNMELNVPQKIGTVSKCIFSADRLREGKLPYCVSSCPNSVYWFGDANEDAVTNGTSKETVRLSTLLKDNAAYHLLPELGTKPSVWYLPEKNRMVPFKNKITKEDLKDHHS